MAAAGLDDILISYNILGADKHAFPGRARGRVEVGLRRDGNHAVLSVEDDGVGLDALWPRLEHDGRDGCGLLFLLAAELGGMAAWHARSHGGAVNRVRFPSALG